MKNAMPTNRTARTLKTICLWMALVSLCSLMILPVLWAVSASLKPLDRVYEFPPTMALDDPQWSNYAEAFQRLPMLRFMLNSFWISMTSVAGAVLTSSMAGFALARITFRRSVDWRLSDLLFNRRMLFTLLIISLLIPAQVLLVPRFALFQWLGWMGTYKPLIVPAWLGGGAFNVLLFRQFFKTIPQEMDDAARLDGATPWQTYWHVLLPMARPAVVAAALLSFVIHWQEFLDPLIYLSDFQTFPVSLGLRMYQSMAGTWANLLMAASLVTLIPVVIVFILCERHLMTGLRGFTSTDSASPE